jgi:hypothetical protein
MAGSKSNYLENAIVNHVLRNTALTSPAAVYVGLFTVAAGEAGGQTEVSGNTYARQSVTFGAPADGVTSNTNLITFPTPTPSGWGTIVGWGIFDASSAGNLLYYSDQTPNEVVNAGNPVQFAIGAISISEA